MQDNSILIETIGKIADYIDKNNIMVQKASREEREQGFTADYDTFSAVHPYFHLSVTVSSIYPASVHLETKMKEYKRVSMEDWQPAEKLKVKMVVDKLRSIYVRQHKALENPYIPLETELAEILSPIADLGELKETGPKPDFLKKDWEIELAKMQKDDR
jgi:hypothetical protein